MNKITWATQHPIDFLRLVKFCATVKDYDPKKVNLSSTLDWLNQFPEKDHQMILSFLLQLHYYSKQKTIEVLVKHNQKMLDRLGADGIESDHVIYVTIDQTASSSHLMLNMLRDAAQLERKRVRMIDSKNLKDLIEATNALGNGAIVYIDDFSGTGTQFLKSRNFVAEQVPLIGQFSEFFLLPCICREAFAAVSKVGVEVVCDYIHDTNDRPLHADCITTNEETKRCLIEYCKEADSTAPLGYKGLASMVIFYRNTPNTTPAIFRGNVGQDIKFGIFPRTTDLSR